MNADCITRSPIITYKVNYREKTGDNYYTSETNAGESG